MSESRGGTTGWDIVDSWVSPLCSWGDTVELAEGDGGNQRRLSASGTVWSMQFCEAARDGQSDPSRISDPEGKANPVTGTS